jgi:AAA15 family ATPase/GTPase
MSRLKKLKEDRISIASKILKKDEDFLPVSSEFIKDLKNKTLLENSALKLSISDYELMCRKDKVLNMMAIALNKPKAKLKKFCKHITVFKENISKSPKSIANKINGINGPITNLPIGA